MASLVVQSIKRACAMTEKHHWWCAFVDALLADATGYVYILPKRDSAERSRAYTLARAPAIGEFFFRSNFTDAARRAMLRQVGIHSPADDRILSEYDVLSGTFAADVLSLALPLFDALCIAAASNGGASDKFLTDVGVASRTDTVRAPLSSLLAAILVKRHFEKQFLPETLKITIVPHQDPHPHAKKILVQQAALDQKKLDGVHGPMTNEQLTSLLGGHEDLWKYGVCMMYAVTLGALSSPATPTSDTTSADGH